MNRRSRKTPGAAARRYVDRAYAHGVSHAVLIDPASVVTGEWVRLKCQYGCPGYGRCLTCPPYSPTPATTAQMLSEYRSALLLQTEGIKPRDSHRTWTKMKRFAVELEREVFLDNHPKAFALTMGPCSYCRACRTEEGCIHTELARPSMEGCGIDVYSTARNNGLTLDVVSDPAASCSYLALLLID